MPPKYAIGPVKLFAGYEHTDFANPIGDVFIERLRRPDDAAALHGRRKAEIGEFSGLAGEYAVQAWADFVGAGRELVAGDAFLEAPNVVWHCDLSFLNNF